MKTTVSNLTTKEKIVRVAMDIIAKEGFQKITVRKIAAKAGVNIAAVNYHFGSKDAVINEALRQVTDELKNTFQHLNTINEDAETKLTIFINDYSKLMLDYPDIIRNMISQAIYNKPLDQHAEYMGFLHTQGIDLIKQTIRQIRPELDDHCLSLKTLHLMSSLSYHILLGEQISLLMGLDLYDEETFQMHTRILLENVCRH